MQIIENFEIILLICFPRLKFSLFAPLALLSPRHIPEGTTRASPLWHLPAQRASSPMLCSQWSLGGLAVYTARLWWRLRRELPERGGRQGWSILWWSSFRTEVRSELFPIWEAVLTQRWRYWGSKSHYPTRQRMPIFLYVDCGVYSPLSVFQSVSKMILLRQNFSRGSSCMHMHQILASILASRS